MVRSNIEVENKELQKIKNVGELSRSVDVEVNDLLCSINGMSETLRFKEM